jgi:hypothetical protein
MAKLWQKLTISTPWQKPWRPGFRFESGLKVVDTWNPKGPESPFPASILQSLGGWQKTDQNLPPFPVFRNHWHGIFVVEKLGLVNPLVRSPQSFFGSIRKSKKGFGCNVGISWPLGHWVWDVFSWFFYLRTDLKPPRKSLLCIAFSGHHAPVREHILTSERRAPRGTRK